MASVEAMNESQRLEDVTMRARDTRRLLPSASVFVETDKTDGERLSGVLYRPHLLSTNRTTAVRMGVFPRIVYSPQTMRPSVSFLGDKPPSIDFRL